LASLFFLLLGITPVHTQNATATLEFSVSAIPTGGRPEKVMQQAFYLLRASLEEIERIASQQLPAPDKNAFIDEQDLSPELKEWMKRTKIIELRGPEFIRAVTVDDIMTVPELKAAYVARNQIMVGLGFPKRKAKPSDQEKNPQKWEESEEKYWRGVKDYATLHSESKDGMEEQLLHITSATQWANRMAHYEQQRHQLSLRLIHSHYMVARTETDYQGSARLAGLAPGRYWLTTLWNEVRAGDVQLSWDLAVDVAAGETRYLELNNANAVFPEPARPPQPSSHLPPD
jgi:hypothetical protein